MISAVLTALGFIGAVVTFFAFDIRSVYAIRSGKTKKKAMQESRRQYAVMEEQKQPLSSVPNEAPGGKRNRSARFKAKMGTVPAAAEESVSNSDKVAAALNELAGVSAPTEALGKRENPAKFEKMTAPAPTPGFRFEMIEDTVVTHTDEIVY